MISGCAEKVVEEEYIPYDEEYTQLDSSLYDFEIKEISAGSDGLAQVTYKIKKDRYGDEIDRTEVGRKIIEEPTNRILAQGSKKMSGVLLILRSGTTKMYPWALNWYYGDSMISGWSSNYKLLAKTSLMYFFAKESLERVGPEEWQAARVSKLLEECPGLKSSGPCGPFEPSPFLNYYPTINFKWEPIGEHRFSLDERGVAHLSPKIEIPPQIQNLFFFFPFDLGNGKEGIVMVDRNDGVAYTCSLEADGATNVLDARQMLSNFAISPDRKKIAFAYNSGIFVSDAELGLREIVADWPLNEGQVWDTATTMVGFNPDSDLVVFTWPDTSNSLETPGPSHSFFVGSWRTDCMVMIAPELKRDGRDASPFFWLAE